ncbi:hypothetical protein F3Y22_tig00110221pilonHSYRG00420 [Hibiscus syriacus]|uniref:Uncharacterized protein n=1 Tax=Hibiscus syriacus TaxID=106335 RepID=A0A6A3B702_HIBSY|nr:uncharacterized protein LOC120114308 [Hibiscus syriacus]KAE8712974.1 hypothetical protein F3Y22_tig00110221pilonHSYRG00420 [Hibiscus syriacus]
MVARRQLTAAQRSAKIEHDRRLRRERKLEFERLQNTERELQGLVVAQRNENASLKVENQTLNDMVSELHDTVNQLRDQNRELRLKKLGLEQTMKLADSWFAFEESSSPNEEVANNESIAEDPRSSQSGTPKRISERAMLRK